jgi:tocopherol O-methyltransferase
VAPSDVARHYDELDRFYRELWGEDVHHGLWRREDEDAAEATENLTRFVADRVGLGLGERVCDVGCGYGGPALTLTRGYGARVVGVTLSRRQAEHARRRSRPGPSFVVGDWLDNAFADDRFDVVAAIESVSHMTDKRRFMSECRRVLVPGGRLVVAAWLAAEAPGRWQRRHLLEPICAEGRLPGLATASEYRGWMAEAGLTVTSFDDLSADVRRTWTICVRRLATRLIRDADARRYLLDARRSERVFALTVGRIWLAYRVGALRYGLFTAQA